MIECAKKCIELNVSCPCSDCRMHLDYEEDQNCCFISIDRAPKDGMVLREVAKRFGISYVRVKQIEEKAIEKLAKSKLL